ncbi:MAG: low molecular weight protein-tyrosine-phosphatase, partial [Gammaproteobacteria bacterium]
VKVLFVCLGNICRSPAAEAVFREYCRRAGHAAAIEVDSAGIIGYHEGAAPDQRMQQAASGRGYRLESVARQVRPGDINEFDLIIAMDYDNLNALREIADSAHGHIRLLGSYIEGVGSTIPAVPDPYYGGDDGFETVLDMLESACPLLLDSCLEFVNSRS